MAIKKEIKIILENEDALELVMICHLIKEDDILYNCEIDEYNFRKRIVDFSTKILKNTTERS